MHWAVLGRVAGDEEDTCMVFSGFAREEAEQEFMRDLEARAVQDRSWDPEDSHVRISHVLSSQAPMVVEYETD
jgi:hypothetical protein